MQHEETRQGKNSSQALGIVHVYARTARAVKPDPVSGPGSRSTVPSSAKPKHTCFILESINKHDSVMMPSQTKSTRTSMMTPSKNKSTRTSMMMPSKNKGAKTYGASALE